MCFSKWNTSNLSKVGSKTKLCKKDSIWIQDIQVIINVSAYFTVYEVDLVVKVWLGASNKCSNTYKCNQKCFNALIHCYYCICSFTCMFIPSGTVKQWPQLEGSAFEFQPEVFLYRVCMFSLCLRGFMS